MKWSDAGDACAVGTGAALKAVDAIIGSPNTLRWPNDAFRPGVPGADPYPSLAAGALFEKNIFEIPPDASRLSKTAPVGSGAAGVPAMRARAAEKANPPSVFIPLSTLPPTLSAAFPMSAWETETPARLKAPLLPAPEEPIPVPATDSRRARGWADVPAVGESGLGGGEANARSRCESA